MPHLAILLLLPPADPAALASSLTNASADVVLAAGREAGWALRRGVAFVRGTAALPGELRDSWPDGTVEIPSLQIAGLRFQAVKARFGYREGEVVLEALSARLPGAGKPGTLTGQGSLRLDPPRTFSLQLRADGFDLTNLRRLPPGLRPPLAVEGKARIEANLEARRSRALGLRGTLRATEVSFGGLRLGTTEVRFAVRSDAVTFDVVRARVLGGEVTGVATLPIRESDVGEGKFTLKEVDLTSAVKALTGTTLPLKGRVSGTVKTAITASVGGQQRTLRALVELTGPNLRVRNVPTQGLRGEVRYRDGQAVYDLEADVLGSKVRLEGRLPAEKRR